ncbi:hypothetical protein [Amycolatopsis sp. lyj-84]|uniref:hypothetical protein n=1 Tax=Amycolatopsis sp. lyj-84 TaxID=2789284 RepID=UPI00397DBDAB
MDRIRERRERRRRLEGMLLAWSADVRSVPLPAFDAARVDEVVRWLRAADRPKAG